MTEHQREAERRHLALTASDLVVDESRDDSPPLLSGYAAVFDTLSEDLGPFFERIRPGAFGGALKASDVRGLFNHSPDHLLARQSAGTLRLAEDDRGLRFELDLDSDPTAQFVRRKIQRRELTGASFSFTVDHESGYEITVEDGKRIRTILPGGIVELFDVGPVTFPAYEDTRVSARSLESAEAWSESQQAGAPSRDQDAVLDGERQRLYVAGRPIRDLRG